MPPHAGQGGSLALEDAAVLAELLSQSDDGPAVLTAYTERRRKRIDGVRTQSHAAARA
jgi:2-polyprenyl-6-methoxyphenol hydroxylase-like FAD-dependent oxidoreductase